MFPICAGDRSGRILARIALVLVVASGIPRALDGQENPVPHLDGLRDRLEALAADHRGRVGIVVEDLEEEAVVSVRGDTRFPTASTIKVPILVELFHRIEEGPLRRDAPLVALQADLRPGTGVLRHLDAPHRLTVGDAAYLMTAHSDNTATNLLIRTLGIRAVNERMAELGLETVRLHHEVFGREATSVDPDASERWGLGVATPRELAGLFSRMYRSELVTPRASEAMLELLRLQEHRTGLPRRLPDGVEVAHKTGSVARSRSDCGVVYGAEAGARDLVVCVMTDENEDTSWRAENAAEVLAAEVARVAFEHVRR